MKTVNKILRVLVMVFGIASLVLFFTEFAKITMGEVSKGFVGAQLAFGSEVTIEGVKYDMAKSAHILFCFWLTAIGAIMSIFSFKSKKLRYAVSAIAIVDAVYLFVIRLSSPERFVDVRPLKWADISSIEYAPFALILAIVVAVFAILSVAYLLLDDYIEVLASKGEKLTILKRIVRFFRDYKSEVKKIVWPNIKDVAKNTVVVLVMCLIVGALIWIVDFGLGQLLNLILGV